MKKQYWVFLYIWVLFPLLLQAAAIEVTAPSQSLLKKSAVYLDREGLSFDAVRNKKFTQYRHDFLNLAYDIKTTVWLRLELKNSTDTPVTRILELSNPLLSRVTLHDGAHVESAGMLHLKKVRNYIDPYFTLQFAPQQRRTIWLEVSSEATALQFALMLKSPEHFHHDDQIKQNSILYFFGMISAFLILSLLLYLYLRDNSYLYYALYLALLLLQQLTYVGFNQLHAPRWWVRIDHDTLVPNVAILIIAAALYAMSFLKTDQFPFIHRIYRYFMILVLLEIPLVGTFYFYIPEVPILTGLVFVLFNTFVGIYVYSRGHIQARFFTAAWLVLFVAYLLLILDTLGFIDVMYHMPHLLMWATAFEAMLLMMAFVDRFGLLQREKEQLHEEFVTEYHLRQNIIENEVAEKTEALSQTIRQKELLFKELHHRVKNNLQLILSMIRLQHDHAACEEENHMLQQLEGRIGAIARTHELLYQGAGDEQVDMVTYVEEYIEGMEESLQELNIELESDVTAMLPLKEAVYVGLIINELVSNAVKYAYGEDGGIIYIRLKASGQVYLLEVCDEGKGYDHTATDEKSLGMTLVTTLVEEQLEGSLEVDHTKGTHYKIRFVV